MLRSVTMRELLADEIESSMRYAIEAHPDGNTTLVVYGESFELSPAWLRQLVELLQDRLSVVDANHSQDGDDRAGL